MQVMRVKKQESKYRFGEMRHGDAIEVDSKAAAFEVFRNWRKATGHKARLVSSREFPRILYFIDETIV